MEDVIIAWLAFNALLMVAIGFKQYRHATKWDRMNRAEGIPNWRLDTGSFRLEDYNE